MNRTLLARWNVTLFGTVLAAAGGCQQHADSLLQGTWIGRPDTAEARAAREAEKYGEPLELAESSNTAFGRTDWEAYDIELRFRFGSHDRLEMSRADGSEAVSASWSVLDTSPTGCTIEVVTEQDAPQQNPAVRRFHLEYDEREGALVGFLLTEVRADRGLGALYFSRAGPLETQTAE